MDTIQTRWGASVDFALEVDSVNAVSATFYVGKLGEAPVISKTASFVDGEAFVNLDSELTKVTPDEYSYQITVVYTGTNQVKKFPEVKDCENGELPKFIVLQALDEGV